MAEQETTWSLTIMDRSWLVSGYCVYSTTMPYSTEGRLATATLRVVDRATVIEADRAPGGWPSRALPAPGRGCGGRVDSKVEKLLSSIHRQTPWCMTSLIRLVRSPDTSFSSYLGKLQHFLTSGLHSYFPFHLPDLHACFYLSHITLPQSIIVVLPKYFLHISSFSFLLLLQFNVMRLVPGWLVDYYHAVNLIWVMLCFLHSLHVSHSL